MRHSGVQPAAAAAAVLVLFATGAVTTLGAQDAADWLRVSIVHVVPEQFEDYIELQINEVNPGLQRAGIPWRSAWRTAEFGDSYELQFITPLRDLADYDAGGPLARVMRPDRFQRLADRLRRATVSRHVHVAQYLPELSVETDDLGDQSLARVSTLQIAPGRVADWTMFLRRNREEFRGAGVAFGVYQRMFGPGPTSWQVVENHASFTELVRPSIIVRAFGDNADSVSAELAGVVVSVERAVLRYDPELSYTGLPPR